MILENKKKLRTTNSGVKNYGFKKSTCPLMTIIFESDCNFMCNKLLKNLYCLHALRHNVLVSNFNHISELKQFQEQIDFISN